MPGQLFQIFLIEVLQRVLLRVIHVPFSLLIFPDD
jgi:hypothetical protein